MKKFIIANPFNCWKLLKPRYYSIIGNDMCECLKSLRIGQSAGKFLNLIRQGKASETIAKASTPKRAEKGETLGYKKQNKGYDIVRTELKDSAVLKRTDTE